MVKKNNIEAIGHNSGTGAPLQQDKLKEIVTQVEKLEEEVRNLSLDRREIYARAKDNGFAPKQIRKLVRERRDTPEQRREDQETLDLYRSIMGDFAETDLGKAGQQSFAAGG